MNIPVGMKIKEIKLKKNTSILNAVVLLSNISNSDYSITDKVAYRIETKENGESTLKIITTSLGGDNISYLIKYLF